ncbi:hypothetical protein G8J22_00772 [Lentilactobacillus hilgardii]|uniref:hypothetical protein n=1 Tax=Lentilactobacillus hilgardii TaxID=1588 RepID=UPI00019C533C|nr:hypothetical protein [Lentilactobacillus hilgardii]EEI20178.1 hypothetical protein HMPREF0497_1085 [Lentilactobacillus buchneri ATCC 11577]QIR08838.1 hypothetical protein G8J22_00772 [Lentilactobacillus hilgardii]
MPSTLLLQILTIKAHYIILGDNSQWALQSSSQYSESVEEAASSDSTQNSSSAVTGWNSVGSSSAVSSSDSTSSSSSNSNGGTTTTYDNANSNNVDPNSDSSSSASSSSADANSSSSEPMLGLGDKGSAGAGSGADKVVKKIIDKVVPGGGLDNTKPNVPANNSSSATTGQQAETVTGATDSSRFSDAQQSDTNGQGNAYAANSAVAAQAKRQTAIEKPSANDAMTHNSFANRVSKSDSANAQKNTTKLVSFNTFSNLFYKQALNNKKNPGKFTTSKGKKVTITTPVSSVKYTDHDVNGIVETLPVIITLSIIGIVAVSFIIFDPLRFIFR